MHEIYGQQTKVALMLSNIHNTESILMIKLDSMRNTLLTVDLSLNTFMALIAVSTFITGAFGMNLNSNLQVTETNILDMLLTNTIERE